MSILSRIELCKGDLYRAFNTVYCGLPVSWDARPAFEKFVYKAISECPLDKWPAQVEKCVKTYLNTQICDALEVHIVERDHPIFESEIMCFDFYVDCYFMFSVFANKLYATVSEEEK